MDDTPGQPTAPDRSSRIPGFPDGGSFGIYEAVLSSTPDLVYVFDLNHRFIYANDALLAMWGKTWDEAVGRNCLELGYEAWHAEMHGREIDQVAATGQAIRGEVPFHGTHGLRVYDYIFTPVFGKDGKVSVVAGTTRDVTDRKREENKVTFLSELSRRVALLPPGRTPLKVAVEMVGEFLGAARCILSECSVMRNRISVMEAWSKEGLPAIRTEHLLDDYGEGSWSEQYTGGALVIEDVLTHPQTRGKSASYRESGVRSYASQARKGDGEQVLILAVTEDHPRAWEPSDLTFLDDVLSRLWPLVEKARIESELQKQSERLSLLWNAAGILLRSEDPETMLQQVFDEIRGPLGLDVYVNFLAGPDGLYLASCRGLEPEEVEQIRFLEFGQAVCGAVAATRCPLVANEVQTSGDPRVSVVKSFGLQAYLCNPLMAGERLLGTLSFGSRGRSQFSEEETKFVETITHYVTAAYVRLRLMDDLRDSDKKKDQFLATLAHELRNPISPILTGLEVIRLCADQPEKVGKVSEMIRRQTSHMVHLIDDLLELSRITTGKFTLKSGWSDIAKIAADAVEVIRPQTDQKQQTLTVELPDREMELLCDPHRISQVLSNLLVNAHKYTPVGGRIALRVARDRDAIRIEVEDNGIGIAEEAQRRVFGMFEQEDGERKDGLGIGLTLVKALTEMHGGTVTLESGGRGQGSRFLVRLPHGQADLPAPGGIRMKTGADSYPERVLVVDDEQLAAEILRMMLDTKGITAEVAFDGREAVDKCRSLRPEVVFMDLEMPGMNGFQAAEQIRREFPGIVLVALSGWGREEDKMRTAGSGFVRHMVKPVSPDEIFGFLGSIPLRAG